MTVSEPAQSLRARTQTENTRPGSRSTSVNAAGRPTLRLVGGRTQTADTPTPAADDHASSTHLEAATDALSDHETLSTLPPTPLDVLTTLWPDPDDVRHGKAGQIAAAAAALIQTAGLAACWATAHTLFATRTRAALFALCLLLAVTTYGIATHI